MSSWFDTFEQIRLLCSCSDIGSGAQWLIAGLQGQVLFLPLISVRTGSQHHYLHNE